MPSESRIPESSFASKWNASLPWRRATMALLPVLAVASAVETGPAQSAGAAPVPMLIDLRVNVTPAALDVCVGETRPVFATVIGRQARVPPRGQRPRWRTSYVPGMIVDTEVGDPSVGSLTPQTARTQAFAYFRFRGQSPGVTTLTFDISNTPVTPTVPIAHMTLQRAEIIQAKVRSCKWRVAVRSQWNVPGGFRPRMRSDVLADLDISPLFAQPRQATVEATYVVHNHAVGTVTPGSCVPTFTVQSSTVDIRAERARNSEQVLLSFFYDPVTGSVRIRCPGGAGIRSGDVSHILSGPLLNLRFNRSGGHATRRHILSTAMPQPMDVAGQTTVDVYEIP